MQTKKASNPAKNGWITSFQDETLIGGERVVPISSALSCLCVSCDRGNIRHKNKLMSFTRANEILKSIGL